MRQVVDLGGRVTGLVEGPRLSVRAGSAVRVVEQVELPGMVLTAAARRTGPRRDDQVERCELLLDDGTCLFAVGHLDDADVAVLRQRARSGASLDGVLAAIGTDRPAHLLVGRVQEQDGAHRVTWVRRGTAAPRLVTPTGVHRPEEVGAGAGVVHGGVEVGDEELLVVAGGATPPDPDAVHDAVGSSDDRDACLRLLAACGADDRPAVVLTVRAATSAASPVLDAVAHPGVEDPVAGLADLHDDATGLPGSALALDRLRQAVRGLDRLSSGVVLLGVALAPRSEAGALGQAAVRLASALRPGDTAARWRGDVLLGICGQVDDMAAADALVRRARAQVRAAVPGARVAALVLWEVPSPAELDALPDRVAWLARRTGEDRPVLELTPV